MPPTAFFSRPWLPRPETLQEIEALIGDYRPIVTGELEPLVRAHFPDLLLNSGNEYRKMLELSTKMTLVGHACTLVAGFPFDERRQRIAALYGACCFLADSFLDDFGVDATREYVQRFDLLLTRGWFDIRTEREQLFYVCIARLFAERDVLDPMLRQAIVRLFLAQQRDVEIRFSPEVFRSQPRPQQLRILEECARNRSGHAITVLSGFLVPAITLRLRSLIFSAGALIMHIDDHGDCYADRTHHRYTFMNEVRKPEQALSRIFERLVARMHDELPPGEGRDLLIGFLFRYYVTRMRKHRLERTREASSWTVYE